MYTTPAIDAAEREELQAVEADARAAEQQAAALEEAIRNGDTTVTMAAIREAEDARELAGHRLVAVRRKYAQQRQEAGAVKAQEVSDDVVATVGAHEDAITAARTKLQEAVREVYTSVSAHNADVNRLIREVLPVEAELRALGITTLNQYGIPAQAPRDGTARNGFQVVAGVGGTDFKALPKSARDLSNADIDHARGVRR